MSSHFFSYVLHIHNWQPCVEYQNSQGKEGSDLHTAIISLLLHFSLRFAYLIHFHFFLDLSSASFPLALSLFIHTCLHTCNNTRMREESFPPPKSCFWLAPPTIYKQSGSVWIHLVANGWLQKASFKWNMPFFFFSSFLKVHVLLIRKHNLISSATKLQKVCTSLMDHSITFLAVFVFSFVEQSEAHCPCCEVIKMAGLSVRKYDS